MTSKTPETMMTGTDGSAVMAGVILLLEVAADRCLSLLATVPAPRPRSDSAKDCSSPGRDDPIELVRSAEALTRTVPIEALPAGSSRVVVGLCDLLREHADARP